MQNDANNGHKAPNIDVQTPACTLYVFLFAWADSYNNVMNAYSAHDVAKGS